MLPCFCPDLYFLNLFKMKASTFPYKNMNYQRNFCLLAIRHISSARLVCNSNGIAVITWFIQLKVLRTSFLKVQLGSKTSQLKETFLHLAHEVHV